MKILCVTHSERPFVEARSSLNALETRFPVHRFDNLPALESLPGVDVAVPFNGALSLWMIDEEHDYQLTFLRAYKPGYKVQSAVFYNDSLLVYGADRLEVLNTDFEVVKTITDPWMAGGHTIHIDSEGFAWINSAPANAALKVNVEQGSIIERLPMPDRYGQGYKLSPDDDVRASFVPTDLQPTHINCVYPTEDGLLVTLWIPGVVGYFDKDRSYREIVSGLRGCHGGKRDAHTRDLYLTDSPAGIIWFFDIDTGVMTRRLQVDSLWLHDVDQVDDQVLAAGLSDKNEIQIISRETGGILQRICCDSLGQAVMFVNVCEVAGKWLPALQKAVLPKSSSQRGDCANALGEEYVPPLLELNSWGQVADVGVGFGAVLKSEEPLQYEFLLVCDKGELGPGEYAFEGEVGCFKGGVTLGLLDIVSNEWISQLVFDALNASRHEKIVISETKIVKIVIAAYNTVQRSKILAEVRRLSLRQVIGPRKGSPMANGVSERAEGVIINRRDEMLGKLQAELQAQAETIAQTQQEVNLRDEMSLKQLQTGLNTQSEILSQLQAEVNKRDELLTQIQAELVTRSEQMELVQGEVNRRDELLGQVQAELNVQDVRLGQLQAEVNRRDELLRKLQADFDAQYKRLTELSEEQKLDRP